MTSMMYAVFIAAVLYFYRQSPPEAFQMESVVKLCIRLAFICVCCILAILEKEDYFGIVVESQQFLDDVIKLFRQYYGRLTSTITIIHNKTSTFYRIMVKCIRQLVFKFYPTSVSTLRTWHYFYIRRSIRINMRCVEPYSCKALITI